MKQSENGYILITTTIVIFSIGTVVAMTLLSFAIATTKSSRATEQSSQAAGIANACAELGIQRLVTTPTYTGTTNATIGAGTCSYVVTQPTGTTSLIAVTATVSTVVRKVQVTMSRNPLAMTLWQEVQ